MARMTIDQGGSKSASSSSKSSSKSAPKAKGAGGGADKAAVIKVVVSVVVIAAAAVWLLYSQGYIGSPPKAAVHAEAEPTPEQVEEVKVRQIREQQEDANPGSTTSTPRASS